MSLLGNLPLVRFFNVYCFFKLLLFFLCGETSLIIPGSCSHDAESTEATNLRLRFCLVTREPQFAIVGPSEKSVRAYFAILKLEPVGYSNTRSEPVLRPVIVVSSQLT